MLAISLGVSPESWLSLTDLTPEDRHGHRSGRTCGPSVLRFYKYRAAGDGCGCHAHADLGLITLSAAPCHMRCESDQGEDAVAIQHSIDNPHEASGGLSVFDPELLAWREVEAGLTSGQLSVFCGEQLAFLSNGALPAPVHRVPPPPKTHGVRFSMPFFARAHPNATLARMVPTAHVTHTGDRQVSEHCAAVFGRDEQLCEEFVLNTLFRRRPWRPCVTSHDGTPDY